MWKEGICIQTFTDSRFTVPQGHGTPLDSSPIHVFKRRERKSAQHRQSQRHKFKALSWRNRNTQQQGVSTRGHGRRPRVILKGDIENGCGYLGVKSDNFRMDLEIFYDILKATVGLKI